MPQLHQVVAEFSLVDDLTSYYRGTFVTHQGSCAYVHSFRSNRAGKITADINHVNRSGVHQPIITVAYEELDLHLPQLGWVQYEGSWFHLSRNPQRRMRKGYGGDMIRFTPPEGHSGHCEVTDPAVLAQIWYGNDDRVSNDCLILGRNIHFHQDIVASIDAEGNVIPAIGKEKLGEFVCKLLASNWDVLALKHSLRLPS